MVVRERLGRRVDCKARIQGLRFPRERNVGLCRRRGSEGKRG